MTLGLGLGSAARLAAVLLALLWTPMIASAASDSDRRIALVIGVSAYKNAPRLANPVNDARAIGDALRRLKFDVTELYDPVFSDLNEGIRRFGIHAAAADVAVVYYAGHGVQVDRENYLIPADAKLERERDLLYEAMPLDRLVGEVSQATRIGIVLLDSCRNNPFVDRVSRSMTIAGRAVATLPGLARVDNVPRNTMVVMAAKAEQIAEDGTDHSPFAAALLAHLQIPGLELSLFFRSVRDTVLRATHNRQEPYVFSSLGADPFFFNPRPPNRPPEIDRITPLEIAEVSGPTPLGMPQPTDPDGDTLTIRFIGLPRFGEVRIDGKAVTLNTIVNADQLRNATYKPDGKTLGPAGSVDILVEDGRGGSITGSLPVSVQSSHRPPVIGAPGRVQVSQQFLDIPAPVSPDGDTLVIKVAALPIGTIRNGSAVVHVGDLLSPQELAGLTFWPEAGFTGHAGTLRYRVDNQHGSVVEGSAEVDVGAPVTVAIAATRSPAAQPPPERPESTPEIAPPVKPPSTVATAANAAIVPLLQGSPPRGQAPAGNNFQDCPDCLRMVRIPAGSFTMGEGAHEPESLPAHRVDVKSFAIGQAPVTVADWKACMKAEMCKFMPRMRLSEDLTPVHNVSWDDIGQFMGWLLKVSGRPYRLPSEAEWEYAARGKTTSRYWWGDSVGMSLANCSDCGGRQDMYGPLPVDALPPNPFGLLDMLGGVAEWTADCWFPNYKGAPSDATPRDTKFCERRVLRGGSFRAPHDEITVYYRASYDAPVRYLVNGFRVARDIE